MTRIFCILFFTGLCLNSYSQTEASKIGYYGRASLGVLTGDRSSVSFQTSSGVSIGAVDLGLALGLELHDHTGYAPVSIESRYNFGKGATQPFIGLSGGYLASLSNYTKYHGGYTFGIMIGMTHYFSKHVGIMTSAGYRYSFTNHVAPNGVSPYDQSYYYGQNMIWDHHRFEFRIGVAFH